MEQHRTPPNRPDAEVRPREIRTEDGRTGIDIYLDRIELIGEPIIVRGSASPG